VGGDSNTPPAGLSVLADFEQNLASSYIFFQASKSGEVHPLKHYRQYVAVRLLLMPKIRRY
jgi:hypothetical protein